MLLDDTHQSEVRPFLFLVCLEATKIFLAKCLCSNRDDFSEHLGKVSVRD